MTVVRTGQNSTELMNDYLQAILDACENTLPFGANYMAQSNIDVNGFYQTIVYKTGGASGVTVATITLTFDASGNVLTYLKS